MLIRTLIDMSIKTLIEEARAIIRAVGDLQAFLAKRRAKRAAVLSGMWTNEGDLTGEIPSHFLHLELRLAGNGVSGIVESRKTSSGTVLPNGSFVGRLRLWGKISGDVVDVRQRRILKYGAVVLRLRKGTLEWQLKSGTADFLPQSAVLWKSHAAEVLEEALRLTAPKNG